MKRMDALRIATNFYTFRMGVKPESMAITVMEPADGRIAMQTTTCNAEGEEITYEIELRPTTNGITMKQVISDCDLSDFIQDVKHLSDLKKGDLFRLESDCVVWRFYGAEKRYGALAYGFTRQNGREISWLNKDVNVYPCVK